MFRESKQRDFTGFVDTELLVRLNNLIGNLGKIKLIDICQVIGILLALKLW